MSTTRRQTQSFLQSRLQQAGIQPKFKHGQNFLVDLNLLRLLFESAQVEPRDVVLEVGTGTGSLTALLAGAAAAVVTVEIDPPMFELAQRELASLKNVTMLRQDALHSKNRMDEGLMAEVRQRLQETPNARFKLAANLPYNVATPIISNLLASPPTPATMTVTIQKELADRMNARPGTKDYGSLSVWVQSQCEVELVRVMPPEVFWPRPKVTSAIVRLTLCDELRSRIVDRAFFHKFVRSLFQHRRKFLRSGILSASGGELSKPQVDEVLAETGHEPNARAEQLGVPAMIALGEAVRHKMGAGG